MDLLFCGLIDIILVLVAIIFMIVGYKKGFIKKLISVAGILVIIIFSFIYCGQFAEFLISHDIFYPGIFDKINTNILTNLDAKSIAADATAADFLNQGLGVPKFIANFIGKGVTNEAGEALVVADMSNAIADYLATALMSIISFFILALGIFIITLILKLIADALRTNKLVRVIDGILGIILYLSIYAVSVCIIFCIMGYLMEAEWFSSAKAWLEVDMQLTTEEFRLSKAVYNGNIIKKFLDLLF